MNLQAALDDFLLAMMADGLSDSTRAWYRSLLGAFADAHAGQSLREMSPGLIRQYLVRLRQSDYSENTISAHTRALHKFFAWCSQEYGLINPMRNIRYPKPQQPKPRAAEISDLRAMFAAAGEGAIGARNRAMLAFLLDSGCRAGGLVRLRVDDVILEDGRALVTEKGNKSRIVLFTTYTGELLRAWMEYRAPVEALFYDLDTLEPLRVNGLYQAFRRIARRAGIHGRWNPHALRHTFAREYIKAGGDLATLSKLMGHRDVSTTVAHYTIFTSEEIRAAHEAFSPVKLLKSGDTLSEDE